MHKQHILNLFINIKNKLFYILDEHLLCLSNKQCLTELINLLTFTLSRIEDIYYKYILRPKLQSVYMFGS